MAGKLYLVATPIGNLQDMTYRAVDTLKTVDLIAAEDTRHTLKLLNYFEISKPMTSYFEHNKREKGEYLIKEMEQGKNIALVTDAGTPAISDPGEDLVRLCIEHNIEVTYVPGAVALITGLILSGLPTGRFVFEGFLSVNKRNRREHLEQLTDERRTMIFYEAPHKLIRTLKDMLEILGDRQIVLARELTKKFEEKSRGLISEHIARFDDGNLPKGEFVLVLEGAGEKEDKTDFSDISVEEHIKRYTACGMSKKDAQKAVAKDRGVSKSVIYKMELMGE